MAETISGTVTSQCNFIHQNAAPFGVTYSGNVLLPYNQTFTSSQVTKLYFAAPSLTTSPTSIDVTSLTDEYGNAISFATVKGVMIVNNDAVNSITVNAAGSNLLFAALPNIVAGGAIALFTNFTVSGSVKIIELASSAGTVSGSIVIFGV